ncbi:family 78 glycoside hydrolase catalytic domain [Cyclobacterium xiamenense]|uniref:family 78 glycoside hydrolase catalytic domain n=1 Tax=Cyclobacterium xiamenense TaxID=1297121 RepID=UPI0035CEAE52
MKNPLIFGLLLLLASPAVLATSDLTPVQLRVEYLTNPFTDERKPRLSWVLKSDRKNQYQSAYRILVASKPELLKTGKADLWDSGRIDSDQTAQVVYGGNALSSRQQCFWKVQSWDKEGQAGPWSPISTWEMGLLEPEDWQADWIGKDFVAEAAPVPFKGKELTLPPVPIFRKEVNVGQKLTKARLYITALGLFEFKINGKRVGKDYLAPGWTDYNQRVHYQAYDVTDHLNSGMQVLQARLSYGWYSGYIGYALLVGNPVVRAFYGEVPALKAQLELTYENGQTQTVATGSDWRVSSGGLLESDILHGETYDARKEPENWHLPGYDDSHWESAEPIATSERRLQLYPAQPVQVTDSLSPVSITQRPNGAYIVNLGQNIAGLIRLRVKGKAGDKIVLRFGEMLHRDGRLMVENLRMARATDTYIVKGDPDGEEWVPAFTYHGFQYVEVSGFPGTPRKENFTGLVLGSNTPKVGHFETDHPLVNQLYQNIVWTQRANFVDIPTDCPQRDERMGWTGDAQIYGGTSALNMDVAAFFTKWIQDLQDAQWESGAYPDYAPAPSVRASDTFAPGWMEAGIINPYEMYRAYGDTRIIERSWANMEKFMAFHAKRSGDRYVYPEGSFADLNPKGGYGDWLSIGKKTPPDLLATIYYGYTAQLMAEMAAAIGKSNRALHFQELAGKIKAAFASHYLEASSGKLTAKPEAYGNGAGYVDGQQGFSGHTQTAYANAIYHDFLTESQEQVAGKHLADLLEANGGKLATGFLGVKQLLPALSATGRSDLAYQLLLATEYPSWGFEIENGATTIWERWDSYVKDDPEKMESLNAGMNSFSHYAFGSVYEWMFRNMAGIQADLPGYKSFTIAPEIPENDIHRVHASLRSIHGEILSSWTRSTDSLRLDVIIPVNTRAVVWIPAVDPTAVHLDGKPLEQHADIRLGNFLEGRQAVLLGSGEYRFESILHP